MEVIPPEIQRIFDAKEQRRKELAKLPIEEKVKIIIRMQKMVAPILRARGVEAVVWESEDEMEETDT